MRWCHWCGDRIGQHEKRAFWREECGIVRFYHEACHARMVDEEAAAETPEEAQAGYEEDMREER